MNQKFFFSKIEGLDEAIKKVKMYDAHTMMGLEDIISNSGKAIAKEARIRVPMRTGKLKKSIRSSFKPKRLESIVYNTRTLAPHGHFIEFGVAATTIKPKRRKFLKIPSSSGNHFTNKPIHIPARSARPFMNPAYQSEKPRIEARIKKLLREV